jgi:hypothetical protein
VVKEPEFESFFDYAVHAVTGYRPKASSPKGERQSETIDVSDDEYEAEPKVCAHDFVTSPAFHLFATTSLTHA